MRQGQAVMVVKPQKNDNSLFQDELLVEGGGSVQEENNVGVQHQR